MNHLIALDWGTSSFRAYLLDAAGAIVETRHKPWGIRQLPDGGFGGAFAAMVAGWPDCPVIAAGMVGSRNGWQEAPYLDIPAGVAGLAAALVPVPAPGGRLVYLVPGLRNSRGPDVMRGEETQLVGALALRPPPQGEATVVLPGTHSKWVRVKDGEITDFVTTMTGELFALLSRHSILAVEIKPDAPMDVDAFSRGVRTARASGGAGGVSRLFSTRALMLDGTLDASSVPDYLSGLLIGEEIRSTLADGRMDCTLPLRLVGDAALGARYRMAASDFALTVSPAVEDTAAHGLWLIARHAHLHERTIHGVTP